ncbi:GNAT family N-acetyltransferase [Halopseudomonas sp.]|uniref:GNAT family N-acetyltransferase n=1 Tax=Halopseudomonas sp. TaxID=2901191 RepID=UPI003FA5FAEE
MENIEIVSIDLTVSEHRMALVTLLNSYALDPMGGAEALTEEVREALPDALAKRSDYLGILAKKDNEYIGLVNCFEGFSTFDCRPLLNIHDVIVEGQWRGCGVSRRMLEAVAAQALERGCAKLTLEVLEGNTLAQSAYRALGFAPYELDPAMGKALFWHKPL